MNSNKKMTILQTTDQNLAIACQYNSYHPQNNKSSRYNNSRTGDKSLNHNNISKPDCFTSRTILSAYGSWFSFYTTRNEYDTVVTEKVVVDKQR